MTRFIQLHTLISYPPANLNRDDLGNPKTAKLGGVDRLRISSQSLKRAWRTSELFQQALAGSIGTRTKRLGVEVFDALIKAGIAEKQARAWAEQIAKVYGAAKKDKPLEIEQLVHIAPEERGSLDALVATLAQEKRAPTDDELDGLLHAHTAVDVAMFGRMLAAKPEMNGEAAVQVAHAIGVHASPIEDDYFTAVDDLNQSDPGAAHIGESGFAAAVFYQYVCIDRGLLKSNLGGDEALTQKALRALAQAVLTVGPTGKQNSYASRAYAHYALAEKGAQQPRSLSLAFVKPVTDDDYPSAATAALQRVRDNMDAVYGACADARCEFDVLAGTGSMQDLLDFIATDDGDEAKP
ncbi:type I-E CRISPR-associated protein Cas7/Cse4/CasC [Vandammella animalimorsus]|uniref:Type I-E CRISPR-associated protein Cas7/Cse4/CasC n=1 Tax=Vandammella animalimorsus TaxID=2029117 RepID=A0A2A2T8K8_9BURK|nr:type I-E CRISPR-associated protein Cas7/Cse4/CasC [Vandammella animalimorsus]PAT33299.1 type I-E CRISPR-associated protein Cas7/Cse4/CasC [Vandammella animalimorsus]PAX18462.1 type I-E CRISPR-associated protein Cas7/Cse4/CasC [Vandammella animalimorsus]PAX20626.1 type I-E CRISPR-associated protein Cas7/Cse4/CasC [Vandammella animalimorsus]